MFVVTNREIKKGKKGLKQFGKEPNHKTPSELRFFEVDDEDVNNVTSLNDLLTKQEVKKLVEDFDNLAIDDTKPWYQSLRVACELFTKATAEGKSILLFIHGYNNDIGDVLKTALEIQNRYNLIVIPFCWPSNGNTISYLSDKDDARNSATAMLRVIEKIHQYHSLLVTTRRSKLALKAKKKHPENSEAERALFDKLLRAQCNTKISMLCHSMGNYVLKYASYPSHSAARKLVFDNIALVAADVNNSNHHNWVENLCIRNRLYIVINEKDGALKWSRRKPGEEQLERLGQHLKNLSSSNAYYIDVTRNKGVNDEHSYFKGDVVENNTTMHTIFSRIFPGDEIENELTYHADLNVYRSS